MSEHEQLYPEASQELAEQRTRLAPEMRAGAAYAHSALALDTIAHYHADKAAGHPEIVVAPGTEAEANPGGAA